MCFERFQGDMVFIYAEASSEDNLKSINAFYSSSASRKTVKLMPELMVNGRRAW
jgi:hypothetical protein